MSNKRMARFLAVVILLLTIAIVPVTLAYGTENESQLNIEELEENITDEVVEDAKQETEEETIIIIVEEEEEIPEKELTLKDIVLKEIIKPVDENQHVYVTNNRDLSEEERQMNAKYVYYYLSHWGWSDNAIFAALGNMEFESSINPGRWQGGHVGSKHLGFGIVQWTPGAKKVIAWANQEGLDYNSLYTQLCYLQKTVEENGEWIARKNYNLTFQEYATDTEHDVEWLTNAFCRNFERPATLHISSRLEYALKWQKYFEELWQNNQ